MIHKSVLLFCDPVRAFELVTEKAGEWWPPERRHTNDRQSAIHMLESGRFFERARDGREVELGRVRVWDPPRRLVLDWYPGTDRDHPTEVTVTFVEQESKTLVTIDHGPLPASEEQFRVTAPRFDKSWDLVLAALSSVTNSLP